MPFAGAKAAAAYVASSGIKLCALGADGQVLEQAGLQVCAGACLSQRVSVCVQSHGASMTVYGLLLPLLPGGCVAA